MSLSKRFAALGILALFALQWFWHVFLIPVGPASGWLIAGLFALPILPAVILLLIRHRLATYWGAVAALFYFSHGVMETWADPIARPIALAESALSIWIVVAYGWEGLRARAVKRKPAATDV